LSKCRGLARDVIHDVNDGRRHVGGVLLVTLKCPARREKNTSNMADVRQ
jgi:hypothetical protein